MNRTILLKQTLPGILSFKGSLAGASVPATSSAAGDSYIITSSGTSQSKTWAVGDLAIYNGSSGSWTQLSGYLGTLQVVSMPANTAASGSPNQIAFSAAQFAWYVSGTGWLFVDGYQI